MVKPHRRQHAVQKIGLGIDEQPDHPRAARCARGQRGGACRLDMARALGKEHQPDEIGARRQRRIERVGGGNATDLDQRGGHDQVNTRSSTTMANG